MIISADALYRYICALAVFIYAIVYSENVHLLTGRLEVLYNGEEKENERQ